MIKIDENYRLEFDSYNVKLVYENKVMKEHKGKMKEVTERDIGYYPTVSLALKKYMRKSLKDPNLSTIEDLIDKIEKLEEKIDTFNLEYLKDF